MAEEIGKIKYTLTLDSSSFNKDLDEASGKAKSGGSKIAGALGAVGKAAAVGVAAASTAVVGLAKASLDAYADYEQLTGGVETLFKGSADTVKQYADNAYKTAGLSANQYMETVTGFSASLLQSLGGDTAKAADVGDMAITDMADNANKMGTSIESIQYAYQGFAKQNYTMLDNLKLGYGGTREEMERLLSDAQKITGQKYDISNLNDVFQAIHVIQGELDITGTTSKEAATTISGSFNAMGAAWQNVLAKIGTGDDNEVNEAINGLLESFGNVANNLIKIMPNIIGGIKKLVEALAPQIPALLQELLPPIIEGAIAILNALIEAMPVILNALIEALPMIIDALMNLTGMIISHLPEIIGLIFMAIGLLVGKVGEYLGPLMGGIMEWLAGVAGAVGEWFGSFFNSIFEWFGKVFNGIGEFFNNIIESVKKSLDNFIKGVKNVFKTIGNVFKSLWSGVISTVKGLWSGLVGFVTNIGVKIGNAVGGALKGAINGVLGFVEGVVNAPIDAINGLIDVINMVPGISLGHLNRMNLPRLASGGIVEHGAGGSIIMAGEAGEDEWVVPESKMADMIKKLGGTGQNVTINVSGIYATSEKAKREVAADIWGKLQEVNKSRMGAMNL